MLFTLHNTKTMKGEAHGYLTAVLHLAPADEAGGRSVCPRSTPQCRDLCLNTAGRGQMGTVQAARIRRTREYLADPSGFADRLAAEVDQLYQRAQKQGLRLAVRINGTSDLPALARAVERRSCPARFYDYTKIVSALGRGIHYTFSRSERNEESCHRAVWEYGVNVAVVFNTKKGEDLPKMYPIGGWEMPVIDGDLHDLRFLDPDGVIVGLRAKGRARRLEYQGGFVVQV